jgi:mannose-1-phosphate guanylyltransferase
MRERGPKLWAVILAGGSGTRLAGLTRALYGVDLPKQYAVLVGHRSMLQATVARTLELVPPERIVVVATDPNEELTRRQLAPYPGVELLMQPRSLDTAPGLLLPLAVIRARDPEARVVVMPADHHVAHTGPLSAAIDRAAALAAIGPAAVTLLGAAAGSADTEYGWIEPGRRAGPFGARPVERFVEKPDAATAEALHRRGALWNTFIMIARVRRLWEMSARALPEHAARIAVAVGRGGAGSAAGLADAYAALAPANFSRAVLERGRGLSVMTLEGAGWSDWGTPRRVFAALAGSADHDRLVARLHAPRPLPLVA